MDQYAPPAGPPPPKVPAGWTARWNEQYGEWFYVNIYTKKSQWDKPTEPVYPPTGDDGEAPPGPPPSYDPATGQPVSDAKTGASHLSSNNPYASGLTSPSGTGMPHSSSSPSQPQQPGPDISEDERIARQMQAEEDARGASQANRGAADAYYQGQPGSYGQQQQQQLPTRQEGKKGFLGKLLGKARPLNRRSSTMLVHLRPATTATASNTRRSLSMLVVLAMAMEASQATDTVDQEAMEVALVTDMAGQEVTGEGTDAHHLEDLEAWALVAPPLWESEAVYLAACYLLMLWITTMTKGTLMVWMMVAVEMTEEEEISRSRGSM